jgi:pimeloyl-ACP methyl ester carboxylesterase
MMSSQQPQPSVLLATKEQKGILTVHRSGLPPYSLHSAVIDNNNSNAIDTTNKKKSNNNNKKKAPPVLLLLAGFPDSVTTWSKFAPHFEASYHVVSMAYPGMDPSSNTSKNDDDDDTSLEERRWWGYSHQEVVDALLAVTHDYRTVVGCDQIYLLGHDWGALVVQTLAHQHPTALTRIVLEDIGQVDVTHHPTLDLIKLISYQTFFVTLFVVSRLLPCDRFVLFLITLYPWKWFGPVPHETPTVVSPYQMYPYYQQMKSILQTGNVYAGFTTKVPLLFIYGKRKGCMFHGTRYIDKVRATPGCRVLEYADAGHWMHVSHASRMAENVLTYLKE